MSSLNSPQPSTQGIAERPYLTPEVWFYEGQDQAFIRYVNNLTDAKLSAVLDQVRLHINASPEVKEDMESIIDNRVASLRVQ